MLMRHEVIRAREVGPAEIRAAAVLGGPNKTALIGRRPAGQPGVWDYIFVQRSPGLAVVVFATDPTGCRVHVTRIWGGQLTAEEARGYLELMKITDGVIEGAFDAVVARWQAEGTAPDDPIAQTTGGAWGRQYAPVAPLENVLIAKGEVFARLVPNPPSCTVFGAPIRQGGDPPLEGPAEISASGEVKATTDVIARLDVDGALTVSPLAELDAQRCQCVLHLPPRTLRGDEVHAEMLITAITALGVDEQYIHEEDIRLALEAAQERDDIVRGILAAESTPAVQGEDGRLELASSAAVELVEDDHGRVDMYRDSALTSVTTGELLGRIVPPTIGKAGQDLMGTELPARDGKPFAIERGPGVRLEGEQLFAENDGALSVRDRRVSVVPIYLVEGDIDHKVGSLTFTTGTIHIKGSIRPRFSVRAAHDVVVEGAIENAAIRAGGEITVRGPVVGGPQGRLKANGRVTAASFLNAEVDAGGDVIANKEITHSTIRSGGEVRVVKGDGWICGGVVEAKARRRRPAGRRARRHRDPAPRRRARAEAR